MSTKAEILAGLNDQQKDVVINYNGKISLEAVPGAGKTRTMVAAIQYMLKDGVLPSKILAFTFTKKAANELRERVRAAVGVDADKVMICTYHSFCGRLLRGCADYAGRTSNFTIYDEDDKKKVLGEIVKQYFKSVGLDAMKYGIVTSYISKFKADNLSPTEAKIRHNKNSYERACGFIYESYENEMRKLNAFDFDDLTFYAYRIVKSNPEILDAIASRFDYVMSDENQDSNKQNLDFILMLGSKSKNIIMVGDTDQSIYKFRGADVDNVIDVIQKEGFTTKFLSTNYRSTQTIVNAADNVIRHNQNRIIKDAGTINEVGDKIDVVYTHNNASEAEYICKKIKDMTSKNPDLKYNDFCVLGRTQAQLNRVEEQFLLNHIPFRSKGQVPFYCRTEIKDILAYIKFAYNQQDMVSFSRIINVPKRNLGEASLKKLQKELQYSPLNDIMKTNIRLRSIGLTKKGQEGLKDFANVVLEIESMIANNSSPQDVVRYLSNKINYVDYLKDSVKVDGTLEEKLANLHELDLIAGTYSSMEDFLTNSTIDEPNIDLEKGNEVDKVNIMTMHSSKGLEFPVVFIIGANDESVPFYKSHDDPDAIQEERRLFYVSMTRAEKKLVVTCPRIITGPMEIQKTVMPSRFIKEIPNDYVANYKY